MQFYGDAQKKAPGREVVNYRCRVCGGACGLSDDHGRTHFCPEHAPKGFWPHERHAPRRRRAEPAAAPVEPDSDEF